MADVNDTTGLSRVLDRLIERIEKADIPEADRKALDDYAPWKRRRAPSLNTARIYISAVFHSSRRHDRPITMVDGVTEVEDIISAHEAAGCVKAKSVNSKLDGLRDFWRWCEGRGART